MPVVAKLNYYEQQGGPGKENITNTRERMLHKRKKIVELMLNGLTHHQIAEELGIRVVQVRRLTAIIREQWAKECKVDYDGLVAQKKMEYAKVRKEAYEAYEASRLNSKGEPRTPDISFLHLVMDTFKAERELLGLDAPKRMDVSQQVIQMNWDSIAGGIRELVPDNRVIDGGTPQLGAPAQVDVPKAEPGSKEEKVAMLKEEIDKAHLINEPALLSQEVDPVEAKLSELKRLIRERKEELDNYKDPDDLPFVDEFKVVDKINELTGGGATKPIITVKRTVVAPKIIVNKSVGKIIT